MKREESRLQLFGDRQIALGQTHELDSATRVCLTSSQLATLESQKQIHVEVLLNAPPRAVRNEPRNSRLGLESTLQTAKVATGFEYRNF